MAEVKNAFIKSKMNKDLDDRLMPSGEYRTAINAQISKSEGSDVGALENILGNKEVANFNQVISTATVQGLFGQIVRVDNVVGPLFVGCKVITDNSVTNNIVVNLYYNQSDTVIIFSEPVNFSVGQTISFAPNISSIGYFADDFSSNVYVFATDNSTNNYAPSGLGSYNYIFKYNVDNNILTKLVEGAFLNFSKLNLITGVNLLEDLLFFTDNRNQPRKINVTHELGYYTEEHQISVAKYNPYEAISLVKQEIEQVTSVGEGNFQVAGNLNIVKGMVVLSSRGSTAEIKGEDFVTVESVSNGEDITTVTLSNTNSSVSQNDTMYFLSSNMTDQSGNASWPGDPSYLESRFVRFSYRYKFDDNEYSVFAPFTQVAFIPKQKGYFINGQEELAVNSTILEWFENGINNIDLIIPLPDRASNVLSSYKIKEIDILYKESDGLSIKVIDTVTLPTTSEENYYTYSYQSRKPIRTLPESQLVRVYDKVPPLAKAQEITGNRIVYGNFLTKLDPPSTLNYTVNVQSKLTTKEATNFVEYPNSTIKQNRNYQVGFVLADKYGRSSDVILSPVSQSGSDDAKGSTIFAPYIGDDPKGSGQADTNYYNNLEDWFGNSLALNLLSPIVGGQTTGLYAVENGDGYDINIQENVTITDNTYEFTLATNADQATTPTVGDHLRGEYVDYVKVTAVSENNLEYTITTSGRVNNIYKINPEASTEAPDRKFSYTINTKGWYSYKIVVKQTEQDYYNVYLPSAVGGTGFPEGSTDSSTSVSYITLINDNINKIPRDLAEVGPDQKQYRSSVRLFGRVQPNNYPIGVYSNKQYFPSRVADTSTSVGNAFDLLGEDTDPTTYSDKIFKYYSNPIIARVSTSKQFGAGEDTFDDTADRFQLAIYETEPTVSNLDIYWETSQTGLISDINAEVLTGFTGPVALNGWDDTLTEASLGGAVVSNYFQPKGSNGNEFTNYNIIIDSIVDGNGSDVPNDKTLFELLPNPDDSGEWGVALAQGPNPYVYVNESVIRDKFTFTFKISDTTPESAWGEVLLTETLELTNITPSIDPQPTGEYYYFNADSGIDYLIHDFKGVNTDGSTDNNAVNGCANPSLEQEGLTFHLSGDDANLFDLDVNSGQLTPNALGVAAGFNSYNITVTLKDASVNNDGGDGTIPFSEDYIIIKGFTPSNIPSSSQSSQIVMYKGDFDGEGDGENFEGEFIYGDYYLTQGTFYFGIENFQISASGWHSDNPGVNLKLRITISVEYKASLTDNFTDVRDFNNDPISPYDGLGRLFDYSVRDDLHGNPLYFAFASEKPGYYRFTIDVANVTSSFANNSGYYVDWTAIIRDLHYNGISNTQEIYSYYLYTNNNQGWSGNPTSFTGPSIQVYSDQPLPQYNTKLWTNEDLSTVYTPPVANRFYLLKPTSDLDVPEVGPLHWELRNNRSTSASVSLNSSGEVVRPRPTPPTNDPDVILLDNTTFVPIRSYVGGDQSDPSSYKPVVSIREQQLFV